MQGMKELRRRVDTRVGTRLPRRIWPYFARAECTDEVPGLTPLRAPEVAAEGELLARKAGRLTQDQMEGVFIPPLDGLLARSSQPPLSAVTATASAPLSLMVVGALHWREEGVRGAIEFGSLTWSRGSSGRENWRSCTACAIPPVGADLFLCYTDLVLVWI